MTFNRIRDFISRCSKPSEIRKILEENNTLQTITDKEGNSLLHWAVILGNYAFVKVLIEMGVDVDQKNSLGCCALEFAIQFNETRIISLLLEKGAKLFNRNGFTTLHAVSAAGNLRLFKRIAGYYKSMNVRDFDKRTPLHWASQEGKVALVKILIERGAKVNVRDGAGLTPLYYSVTEGNYALFNLLISKGANYRVKYDSDTLLHTASAWNQTSIVRRLVRLGIDVNVVNAQRDTPLHYAYLYNYRLLAEALIRMGANPNIQNEQGLKLSGVKESSTYQT